MNESMNPSEIDAMNRSFSILDRRRRALMENEETSELKDVVKKIREYSISHLEELQKIAIKKLQDNGVEVFVAEDSKEALNTIYNIIGTEKLVAKSKSNTAGEIELLEFLENKGVEVLETDLGD